MGLEAGSLSPVLSHPGPLAAMGQQEDGRPAAARGLSSCVRSPCSPCLNCSGLTGRGLLCGDEGAPLSMLPGTGAGGVGGQPVIALLSERNTGAGCSGR